MLKFLLIHHLILKAISTSLLLCLFHPGRLLKLKKIKNKKNEVKRTRQIGKIRRHWSSKKILLLFEWGTLKKSAKFSARFAKWLLYVFLLSWIFVSSATILGDNSCFLVLSPIRSQKVRRLPSTPSIYQILQQTFPRLFRLVAFALTNSTRNSSGRGRCQKINDDFSPCVRTTSESKVSRKKSTQVSKLKKQNSFFFFGSKSERLTLWVQIIY